jgi:hypothetical protein
MHYIGTTFSKLAVMDYMDLDHWRIAPFKLAATLGIYIGVDMLFHPFYNMQMRFILQNRLPEFQTYRSVWFFFQHIPTKEMWQAVKFHIPMNLMMLFGGISVGMAAEDKKDGARLGLFFICYPLMTVARRLMA